MPDVIHHMVSEMDVISLILEALSLIDGDLGKLGDMLRKFPGYTVKADRIDGSMCISINSGLMIDVYSSHLMNELETDSHQGPMPNQAKISRLVSLASEF